MPLNTDSVTLTALASTALRPYGRGIRSRQWDMRQSSNAAPSSILTTEDLRQALGIYDNQDYPDTLLIDLQVSAEELLEDILHSPLKGKVVTERYADLANRYLLVVRGFGEAGLGTFADPDGAGKPVVEVETDGGMVTLDAATYSVDATGDIPAVVFKDIPSETLSDQIANPVTIRYLYTPAVPNRVKRALEKTAHAFFIARNAGMPFPARSLRESVKGMLGSLVPIQVSAYRV